MIKITFCETLNSIPSGIANEAAIGQEPKVIIDFAQLVKPTPFKKFNSIRTKTTQDTSFQSQVDLGRRLFSDPSIKSRDNSSTRYLPGKFKSPKHVFGPTPESRVVRPR